MNAKLGSTETLEITFSSDLCHKKMLLESLNIPLIIVETARFLEKSSMLAIDAKAFASVLRLLNKHEDKS